MSATFTGVNSLQFTPDNKHAYVYNMASIGVGDVSETKTYFEFTTQSYYLVAKLIGGRNMKSAAECTVAPTFNGESVFKTKWDNGTSGTNNNPMASLTPFIVPPFTTFKLTCAVDKQDEISMGLICDVKGSIEQFDLEVKA